MDYFHIKGFQTICNIEAKQECWLIDFEEKNDLPKGYDSRDYESKGFTESKLIQDFPLRGKAVFLRIRNRRWRHKTGGAIIKHDFSFIAEGSKLTMELSAFLKGTGRYPGWYDKQHLQLLWGKERNAATTLQASG